MKCPECGLTNFAGVEACRRCSSAIPPPGAGGTVQDAGPTVTCPSCFLARPIEVEKCPFCKPSPMTFGGLGPDRHAGGYDSYGKKPWRGHVTLVMGVILLFASGLVIWLTSQPGSTVVIYIAPLAGVVLIIRGLMGQEPPGWS